MFSHECRGIHRLSVIIALIDLFGPLAFADIPKFEYHQIAKIGSRMGQTSLVDVDKDGDLDWITGCMGGQIWWFEYKAPDNWLGHTIAQKAPTGVGGTAFDIDGDLDIFSGGGPLTEKPPHKWFIWENLDGKGRNFKQHEILSGKRCHEAKAADVDRGGDIDICSKPWNGNEHVYLRNMLIEHGNN